MTRERILTVASWVAVLSMFAFIGWRLADQFSLENMYPKHLYPEKYTESAFKSLEYQNAENIIRRVRAERFINELSKGNIR